jgi:hypothetical protein
MKCLIVQIQVTALLGECTSNILYYDKSITHRRAGERVWRVDSDDPKLQSTIPGPTLYFGFPIKKSGDATATGFQKDPSFNNYTSRTLAQLSKHGFRCLPVAKPIGKKRPLVCFPWAIVELYGLVPEDKPNHAFFENTISRASDASSTSLSMLEILARFADEKHDGQHVPPVVTITSIGEDIRVWLAYCEIVDEQLRDHVR